MDRDSNVTERLRQLILHLQTLTKEGELHWERQVDSAHRYARWNKNLLILGPADPLSETNIPRYLFITPFDSPACVEINSNDPELGAEVMSLVSIVEVASQNEPATDPFALTDEVLGRFTN
jgi:hypothetical protein